MQRWLGFILIALFLILQYQLWVGDGSLGHRAELKRDIEEQQIINTQLKARNDVVASEIEDLSNGTEALEEIARSKLGMIAEGETFYLIPEENAEPETQSMSQNQAEN